nr:hypothetical protein [uncultured Psychroserpens sp.]
MISGMLNFNSELFWFEMIRESTINTDDGWYRQYGVVKLSKKQLCKEIEVHRDFKKYVGTHWDEKFIDEPPQFIRGSSNLFL